MTTIKNAIISAARFDTERGLSAWLTLDYGGSGQGFGGYCLYRPESWGWTDADRANYAGHFIWRVLAIAGVEDWSDLIGRTIRVRFNSDEWSAPIDAIGHIIKDDWFEPRVEMAALRDRTPLTRTAR